MVFLCGIHKLQYKYVYFVPRIKNLMETFIFSKIPLIFPVLSLYYVKILHVAVLGITLKGLVSIGFQLDSLLLSALKKFVLL